MNAPVITIDGPAASGKGSVATTVAKSLGFHYLDSGKLYRAIAHTTRQANIPPDDIQAVVAIADDLSHDRAGLQQLLQSPALLTDDTAQTASAIATNPKIRQALIALQHAARQPPGLVADGRDMGTVVFPDATVKVYLIADVEERAKRRVQQLRASGIHATIGAVWGDLRQRDLRDTSRATAPLKSAPDALTIDSTHTTVNDVAKRILQAFAKRHCFIPHPPATETTP